MRQQESGRPFAIRAFLPIWIGLLAATVQSRPDPDTSVDGLVSVPQGQVHPGTSQKDVQRRAMGQAQRLKALQYERWDKGTKGPVIPAFSIGRYEVTNAQWKAYLDAEFKVEHKTTGVESLADIAQKYGLVDPRTGAVLESQWKAIYAFNLHVVADALGEGKPAGEGEEPLWDAAWGQDRWLITAQGQGRVKGKSSLKNVKLPKDLTLHLYRHHMPVHWYGFHKLSGLNVGQEYCDLTKKPEEAFKRPAPATIRKWFGLADDADLPDTWRRITRRGGDFAAFPIRDLSASEIMAFVEWVGCTLPSEFELERAGRGDRPNTDRYTFPGPWDHNKNPGVFAWFGNNACKLGPLSVDDATVAGGDGPFGTRHQIGNVFELTRTFFGRHPYVVPAPEHSVNFGFALTGKSTAWASPWWQCQLSLRTGDIGSNSDLDLQQGHHIASLGFRLARHPQPGEDLLGHTVRRMCYNAKRAAWSGRFKPPMFALMHTGGIDATSLTCAKTPYIHARKSAVAVAACPLWISTMREKDKAGADKDWRAGKPGVSSSAFILGVLRCDIPFFAGQKLSPDEHRKLLEGRKAWEEYGKQLKAFEKRKRKKRTDEPPAKPRGEDGKPLSEPPPPDEYELSVGKGKAGRLKEVGIWRKKRMEPGEWLVVYWNGYVGLANKTLVMPPTGILIPEGKKGIRAERKGLQKTNLVFDPDAGTAHFTLVTEQRPAKDKKGTKPPKDKDLWALCEVNPNGWSKRSVSKATWVAEFKIHLDKNLLGGFEWEEAGDAAGNGQKKPAPPAENDKTEKEKK